MSPGSRSCARNILGKIACSHSYGAWYRSGGSQRSAESVALEQNSQRVTDTRVRSGSPLRARFANQLAEDSGIYRERVLVASMELGHQQTCLGWPGVHRSAADVVGSSHAFEAVRCSLLRPAKAGVERR